MKIEKFKVLLYLKKSGMDKNGKAPIMGRITVNRTMAQFSCKLSCTPSLWNPRASRLEGKSKEAVETNKDIEQLLLSIQKAFDSSVEALSVQYIQLNLSHIQPAVMLRRIVYLQLFSQPVWC